MTVTRRRNYIPCTAGYHIYPGRKAWIQRLGIWPIWHAAVLQLLVSTGSRIRSVPDDYEVLGSGTFCSFPGSRQGRRMVTRMDAARRFEGQPPSDIVCLRPLHPSSVTKPVIS